MPRQGGKAKPLKKPKKARVELDDTDIEFKKRQQEEQKRIQELKKQAQSKKGFVKNKGK